MSDSEQSIPSDYMEFLRCALCSHDFKYENPLYHPITLPKSGLTMCRQCIVIIYDETKCPHDHPSVVINYTSIVQLPTNYPLLIIRYDRSQLTRDIRIRYGHLQSYNTLDNSSKQSFKNIEKYLCDMAEEIKKIMKDEHLQSKLGHFVIKALLNLLHMQYITQECHTKCITIISDVVNGIASCIINHYNDVPQISNNSTTTTTTDTIAKSLARLDYLAGHMQFTNEPLNRLNGYFNEMKNRFNGESNSLLLEEQLYTFVEIIKCCIKIIE